MLCAINVAVIGRQLFSARLRLDRLPASASRHAKAMTTKGDEASRRILALFAEQKARPGHILKRGFSSSISRSAIWR
jgi:hypothetical protein